MDKMKKPSVNNSLKDKKPLLKELWVLFLTFFKIGAVGFGGGYAMIGLIEREVVDKKQWLTSREMLDIIAIAESTPGPISINTSTYVGTKRNGLLGALTATFGAVLPSFLVIFAISFFVEEFLSKKWISYAFKGIRVAVVVLILNALVKMVKSSEKSIFALCVFLLVLGLCIFTRISAIYLLLMCAAIGVIYCYAGAAKRTKEEGIKEAASPPDDVQSGDNSQGPSPNQSDSTASEADDDLL